MYDYKAAPLLNARVLSISTYLVEGEVSPIKPNGILFSF